MKLNNKLKDFIGLGVVVLIVAGVYIVPNFQSNKPVNNQVTVTKAPVVASQEPTVIYQELSAEPKTGTAQAILDIDGTLDSSVGKAGTREVFSADTPFISTLGEHLSSVLLPFLGVQTEDSIYRGVVWQEVPNALDIYIIDLSNPKVMDSSEMNKIGMYLVGQFANLLTDEQLEEFSCYRINLLYRYDDGEFMSIPETSPAEYQRVSFYLGQAINNPIVRDLDKDNVVLKLTPDMEGRIIR